MVHRMKFVLLEHDTRPTVSAPHVSGSIHYDLMIDHDEIGPLLTWRLDESPLMSNAPIRAERIADHRRIYLEFEGEVSGGRGRVRQIARGLAALRELSEFDVRIRLEGESLRGEFAIRATVNHTYLIRLPDDESTSPHSG